MSYDWKEFIRFAHLINLPLAQNFLCFLGSFSKETLIRNGVSRTYYGVYCYSRNYANQKQGFVPSGQAKDHQKLRQHFIENNQTEIADSLDRLREWRNQSDYDDILNDPNSIFQFAELESKTIFNQLR
ncbi:MAG: hypothetical protein COV67_08520 [Nitrospinae bacterium CG11_big_fil_rev_8_21_14_0_20_56_8]|nr:MAG: hypothetical protein COV67_08520 [Nitrospinae bacterium CG11_big_fil_rev_8_21_14_0_20_56_8]